MGAWNKVLSDYCLGVLFIPRLSLNYKTGDTIGWFRVLIKCRQPAKKPATWRFELSTFWGNRVKLESESLKLPPALSYQAAYFNILAVYLKN